MPRIPPSIEYRLREFHPALAQVLYNRGYGDPADARLFLQGELPQAANPFRMADMNKAVSRIRAAIQREEPIAVYGDFDTDGVTATALLIQVLKALGADARPYIPHRVDEGYGLNSKALRQLAQEGVRVVITVDCGIRSVPEVRDGTAAGLDMIVTDHHAVGPELPPAYAVINPKRDDCPYPEDMLAGVGIAYRLADALLRAANSAGKGAPDLEVESLLDLVAIGTVADLAPLDRLENRMLVRQGLDVINLARRPGVCALMDVAGLRPGKVKALNIGFVIGPRLNAAGRLESAMTALDLLMASDYGQAMALAQNLQELNTRRQELTREAELTARDMAARAMDGNGDLSLIFAASPEFLPGIVGLVAGRLAEEYYRPAIVIEQGESESRGSCRSIEEFDIVRALDQCADLLVRHGGHAQAAGFTVRNENLPALQERLVGIAADTLRGQELRPALDVDAEVPIEMLTLELAEYLALLEPTGHHNPSPVLMTRRLPVANCRPVGREGTHLKLTFGEAGWWLDGIAFGLGDSAVNLPRLVDVAYHLEVNEWNGRKRVQLNVQDIRPAE